MEKGLKLVPLIAFLSISCKEIKKPPPTTAPILIAIPQNVNVDSFIIHVVDSLNKNEKEWKKV